MLKDIFNFDFVDRDKERKEIKEFIENDNFDLLVLNGENGIGKTSLIKNIESGFPSFRFIYFDRNATSKESGETYLQIILARLANTFKKSFSDHLKIYFKKADSYLAAAFKAIASCNGAVYLNPLIDVIFNKSIKLMNEKEQPIEKFKVLVEFISKINDKKNHVLVLDNFDHCDAPSYEIIMPFLRELQNDKIIKVIMIISNTSKADDIVADLCKDREINSLYLEKLPSSEEFSKILNKSISISEIEKGMINYIYNYCKGSPQELISLLSSFVRTRNSMNGDNNLIKIADLKKHIYDIRIDTHNFKKSEMFILFLLMHIRINKLGLAELSKIEFECADLILDTFKKLLDSDVIVENYDNTHSETYSFSHDSIYYSVDNYIKNDKSIQNLIPMWSNKLITFIEENSEILNLTYEESLDISARLSVLIKRPEVAISRNFEYADKMVNKGQYNKAAEALSRLINIVDLNTLDEDKITYIIEVLYTAGFYYEGMVFAEITEISSFNYWFYKAKLLNILSRKEEACTCLEQCAKYIGNDKEKLLLLNLKLNVFVEMDTKKKEAYKLFRHYINEEGKKVLLEDAYVLKNAEDFVGTDEENIKLSEANIKLSEAYKIATKYKDEWLQANILHNWAVVLFRLGNYKEAGKKTNAAIEILKFIRPHETSYCYNNLAVINLLNKNFDKALENIEEGLFWNKSLYTELALLCNYAICKSNLHLNDDAVRTIGRVKTKIETNDIKYPDVIRKFEMIASYVYLKAGMREESKKTLMAVKEKIEGTKSAYRLNLLFSQFDEMKHLMKTVIKPKLIYEKVLYETWLVTLSHD